ncbi:hypothetical protein JRO89_XS05G0066000 [Xanthoceras sorbifolium]|uniref:Ephrin RBD domain-containing protein n=1 Tax=Xanthoceras sorbifolium TaxID=99658 RepID=A0ABQ8I0Q6_9ROSI|nr:hypothetical protein JRO89_XS05G0065800 [Xanthoceras sorbifolium]KAH7570193.1 hypothetical protein JRO89_XS05G0066000 [Xanthoceras sorbifolium]
MASQLFILLMLTTWLSSSPIQSSASIHEVETTERSVGQRLLLSFKETPPGSNLTFECSPSGPCVPFKQHTIEAERMEDMFLVVQINDDKYRCSETGYRIPLKCLETDGGSKDTNEQKIQKSRSMFEISVNSVKPHVMLDDGEELITSIKHRSLLDDSSTSKGKSQAYITYRSCIPAVNEEKLSVLGFEGILFGLFLISGSAVYFRRKRNVTMPGVGAGRIPANSRF